ncbi:MAG: CDP-alcohol phosphatidyltransferase family protein [Gammaproteobacteria bacterium]|nr:CDP-alcohol phosphatidyltransferase family protein [Pseudomonadales bacterium]MCP5329517.1 CDP-alcohol phosphatidyltransferase family protein [Pseudomonadales bacterium]
MDGTRRELHRSVLLGSVGIMLGALLLAMAGVPTAGVLRWAALSASVWGLVWWQTNIRLPLNRATNDAPLYPTLGTANRLTLLRGYLIALSAGFLLLPYTTPWLPWLPAFLYSVAAILDRVDGFIARRSGQSSLLGASLDTLFDALGLLIAPLLAVAAGKTHWSYLSVSLAYYVFHLGLRWRERHDLPVYPLRPNTLRRTLAGFQMGYVAVVLWPPFASQVSVPAGAGFMLPLLLGFVVDWAVVSGRLNMEHAAVAKAFAGLQRFSHHTGQPLLRLLCIGCLLYALGDASASISFLGLAGTSALSILTGFAPRIGALTLLVLLALQPAAVSDSLAFIPLLFSTIWLLLLGGGRGSLWQGDGDWVERHDGAP